LTPVGSTRNWAPNVCSAGNHYIPLLYEIGADAIKKMRRRTRSAIRAHLTQLVTEKFADGWLPLLFVKGCASPFVTNPDRLQKLALHCRAMMPLAAEQYQWMMANMDNNYYALSEIERGISFVRDEVDPLPGHENEKRVCVARYSYIRCIDKLEDGVTPFVVVHEAQQGVRLDGVIVDKSYYLVNDWTLSSLYQAISNVEQRRVLMRRHGLAKFLTPKNSTVLDIDSAPGHTGDPSALSITRALLQIVEGDGYCMHVVVANDGSTDRIYHMPATTATGRGGTVQHCRTLQEWDAAVGQPSRLYAQA
jgi:hypothetical protein